uniref:Uncharacterized protein n=1 Tax=Strigamia maritima TaxID=126957 RepID=T1J323_STRMM
MAGVFVVIVPSEAFERKLREKDGSIALLRPKSGTSTDKARVVKSAKSFQESKPAVLQMSPSEAIRTLSKEGELPLKQILEVLIVQLAIADPVWHTTRDGTLWQVLFTVDSHEQCENVLQALYNQGIGRSYESTVCVVPCSVFYKEEGRGVDEKDESDDESETGEAGERDELAARKDLRSLRKQFIQSIKARLTVAQVVGGVKAGANLTFDYIMFVIIASLIAGLGLVENSPVVVVASMLISPIMGPIMAWTFGVVIKDKHLQRVGIKSEIIGLCTCLCTGFVFGCVCGPLDKVWGFGFLPTLEMLSRCKLRTLWVGVLVALPSGAGVALSILGGNAGSLVGVAISASLLPPAVNAGMMWAYALVIYVRSFTEQDATVVVRAVQCIPHSRNHETEKPLTNGSFVHELLDRIKEESFTNRPSLLPNSNYDPQYSNHMVYESLLLGLVSLLLTFVNIVCIVCMAILVLKIKEVAPYTSIPTAVRFWKEDIKITRDYNKTLEGKEAKDFRQNFLQEWAAINQLDHKTDPAKTASQLNQLRSVVEEAEDDEVYQTVIRYIGNPSPIDAINQLDHKTDPAKTASQLNQLRSVVEEAEDDEVYQTVIRYIGNPSPIDVTTNIYVSLVKPHHVASHKPAEKFNKKPKVWDIDFTPRRLSGRRRIFSDSHERYNPLDTINESDTGKPKSPPAKKKLTHADRSVSSSSGMFHGTPSRLFRSLLGRRFVVTRVDRPNRKSKRNANNVEDGV